MPKHLGNEAKVNRLMERNGVTNRKRTDDKRLSELAKAVTGFGKDQTDLLPTVIRQLEALEKQHAELQQRVEKLERTS